MFSREGRTEAAYEVGARAVLHLLRKTRGAEAGLLEEVRPGEIVEVMGAHDRIGLVLKAGRIPFVSVPDHQLETLDWNRLKLLFVNCPGCIGENSIGILREWVRAGGALLTTDWALKHTLEPAFPGRIRHNGVQTPDTVVAIEPLSQDPLLSGLIEDGRTPRWWLEAQSFPIEVLDTGHVDVLVKSAEAGIKWGADAVVVRWQEGQGEVIHMLSHLYLQRSETRTAKDAASAASFFMDQGLDPEMAKRYALQAGDLTAAELKSAQATAKLAMELVIRRKLAERRRGGR